MPEGEDWRRGAACRTADPDLFFPVGTKGPALRQIEQAKAICRTCDVIEQCLRWAKETSQDYGIWGGTTEDERAAQRRRSARNKKYAGRVAVSGPVEEVVD